MHVSRVKMWICLVWVKKFTVLYSCLRSSTRLTMFGPAVSKERYGFSHSSSLDLNWEANKTHLHDITHGNNHVWCHLPSNRWHKTLRHDITITCWISIYYVVQVWWMLKTLDDLWWLKYPIMRYGGVFRSTNQKMFPQAKLITDLYPYQPKYLFFM